MTPDVDRLLAALVPPRDLGDRAAVGFAKPVPSQADPEPLPATSAPLPPPPPPRPVDRWQQMANDIAACPRDNVFARAACEQRVRLRYCEGYWGGVPERPFGRQADHGQ